jgi:hypothetical protein
LNLNQKRDKPAGTRSYKNFADIAPRRLGPNSTSNRHNITITILLP